MTRKRRSHFPEFKVKIAFAAAKGDKTVAELAQKYNLYAIIDWYSRKVLSWGYLTTMDTSFY